MLQLTRRSAAHQPTVSNLMAGHIGAGELTLPVLFDASGRLTSPLVVMGIEPGGTRTRSATLRQACGPCLDMGISMRHNR